MIAWASCRIRYCWTMVLRVVHGCASGHLTRTRLTPARAVHRVPPGNNESFHYDASLRSSLDLFTRHLVGMCLVSAVHTRELSTAPSSTLRGPHVVCGTGLRSAGSLYGYVNRDVPGALVVELTSTLAWNVVEDLPWLCFFA